ncbi:hypothetical protein VKT23_018199 [Stygiomarasmius scandens]|uniref:Uncharacterized protein n=1 Tax=Marasmiellus scandens TaxID=2682957 RepID=A0ABR1IPN4_9AGAR
MIPDPPAHLNIKPRPDYRETRPPKSNSSWAYTLWRINMWINCTFGLTVMEPWERFLVWAIFLVLSTFCVVGMIRILPHQLVLIQKRTAYYLWGHGEVLVKNLSQNSTVAVVA